MTANRCLLFLLILAMHAARAQKPDELSVQAIPEPLRNRAHIVVRFEEVVLDVESPERMEERHHKILTFLDKQGLNHAYFGVPYDRFSTVTDIRLELYDAEGKSVKTFKRKDLDDRPFSLDNVEMALENRYLALDLSSHQPPFTVEMKWETTNNGILDYPNFTPQDDYFISVEKAQYTVKLPKNLNLHYKCLRSPEPQIEQGGRSTTYSWQFQNLAAIPDEPYNLPIDAQTPLVSLSPGQFTLEGFPGSFDSWDALAGWNQRLLDALPPLDPKTAAEIRKTYGSLPEIERIRAIYRFVQNSTRYISIQLGIGGWQPFDPNFVHNKKYGDCKALSWYTRSLLQAAGIDARYTLIYRGDTPETPDPDFPDQVFNHVILTVPIATGDTVWLECTSQTNPFGYVGPDISNRKALMIQRGKGALIQMPVFGVTENVLVDSVRVDVPEDLKTVQIQWNVRYDGPVLDLFDGFLDVLHSDAQTQKKWVETNFTLKGRQLQSYSLHLDTLPGAPPRGHMDLQASSSQLLSLTAKRMIFQPNFFRPWTQTLLPDTARVSPPVRINGYTQVADCSTTIPAGWTAESLPAAVQEATPFGSYTRSLHFENGLLHYQRTIALQAGVFSTAQYPALVEFFRKLKKWDEERVVLVR